MDRPAPEEVDYRDRPDLPSHLTFDELSLVHMFAMKFAIEKVGVPTNDVLLGEVEISIMVRDLGPDGNAPKAPWVEFSVGSRRFAMWRETRDLYELNEDGSVPDDPLHYGGG
jgi:hypothetical protein